MPTDSLSKDEFINNKINPFFVDLSQWMLKKEGMGEKNKLSPMDLSLIASFIRHNQVLNQKQWDAISKKAYVFFKNPDHSWPESIDSDEKLKNEIATFLRPILEKVKIEAKGNFVVKRVKQSYFNSLISKIEKNRTKIKIIEKFKKNQGPFKENSKENLIELNSVKIDSDLQDIKVESDNLSTLLDAQNNYLKSLYNLPSILEKACLKSNLFGPNYKPNETSDLLVQTLGLISAAVQKDINKKHFKFSYPIEAIIYASNLGNKIISQSALPIFKQEVMPFLEEAVKNFIIYEKEKACFLNLNTELDENKQEIVEARQSLLISLGVHLDSIKDIVLNALLMPALKLKDIVFGAEEKAQATLKIVRELASTNSTDAFEITNRMLNFLNVNKLVSNVDDFFGQPVINSRLKKYKEKFPRITKNVQSIGTAVKNLKEFFNEPRALSSMLYDLGREYILPEDANRLLIFLKFHNLLLSQPSTFINEEQSFLLFYQESLGKKPFNLATASANYKKYQNFIKTIPSQIFRENDEQSPYKIKDYLDLPLKYHIEDILRSDNKEKKEFLILVLFYRMNHLQSASKCPTTSFLENTILGRLGLIDQELENFASTLKELNEAKSLIQKMKTHVNFHTFNEFLKQTLQPNLDQILSNYKHARLQNILEKMIDIKYQNPDKGPKKILYGELLAYSKDLKIIYSKIVDNLKLTDREIDIIEKEWRTLSSLTNDDSYEILSSDIEILDSLRIQAVSSHHPIKERTTPVEDTINVTKLLEPLLKEVAAMISNEYKGVDQLDQITSNEELKTLCNLKKEYINSINTMVNQIIYNHELKGKFITELIRCINGEIPIALKESASPVSAFNKLFHFAWDALPETDKNGLPEKINASIFTKALEHTFKNSMLGDVFEAQNLFANELEQNPLAGFFKDLRDPLTWKSFNPILENIKTSVINKITEWVTSYGRSLLNTYVFTAPASKLVTNFLQTTPIKNVLDSFYKENIQTVTKEAKDYLIQKTTAWISNSVGLKFHFQIEQLAIDFILKEDQPNESNSSRYTQLKQVSNQEEKTNELPDHTALETFSVYYLQYHMLLSDPNLQTEEKKRKTIHYLFSDSFKDFTNEKVEVFINKALKKFNDLDRELNLPPLTQIIERSGDKSSSPFLQFMMTHIDLSKTDKKDVLKLILTNQMFLMISNAKKEVNSNSLLELQRETLLNLSHLLKDKGREKDKNIFLESATVYKQFQIDLVKASVNTSNASIESELTHIESLLEANESEPILGKTLAEHFYLNSSFIAKLYRTYYRIYDVISVLLTWSLIALPAFALPSSFLLTVFRATLGTIVTSGVFFKLLNTIWEHRSEFKKADQIIIKLLIFLKCLGVTLIRTLVTDRIVGEFNKYFSTIARFKNYFKRWPTKEKVISEHTTLLNLKNALKQVESLLDDQSEPSDEPFIKKFIKVKPLNVKPENETCLTKFVQQNLGHPKNNIQQVFSQPEKLYAALKNVEIHLAKAESICLKKNHKDARFHVENYSFRLNSIHNSLETLSKEIKTLKNYVEIFKKDNNEASTINLRQKESESTPHLESSQSKKKLAQDSTGNLPSVINGETSLPVLCENISKYLLTLQKQEHSNQDLHITSKIGTSNSGQACLDKDEEKKNQAQTNSNNLIYSNKTESEKGALNKIYCLGKKLFTWKKQTKLGSSPNIILSSSNTGTASPNSTENGETFLQFSQFVGENDSPKSLVSNNINKSLENSTVPPSEENSSFKILAQLLSPQEFSASIDKIGGPIKEPKPKSDQDSDSSGAPECSTDVSEMNSFEGSKLKTNSKKESKIEKEIRYSFQA